jgi:hypothetical protein
VVHEASEPSYANKTIYNRDYEELDNLLLGYTGDWVSGIFVATPSLSLVVYITKLSSPPGPYRIMAGLTVLDM